MMSTTENNVLARVDGECPQCGSHHVRCMDMSDDGLGDICICEECGWYEE